MSKTKKDIIAHRLNKAHESLEVAKLTLANNYPNAAISELYYVCFYLISALFAANDVHAATHRGVKKLFTLHFIKTGKINEHWGELIAKLFDKRRQSDYDDFISIEEKDVRSLLHEVEQFRDIILQQLQTF